MNRLIHVFEKRQSFFSALIVKGSLIVSFLNISKKIIKKVEIKILECYWTSISNLIELI